MSAEEVSVACRCGRRMATDPLGRRGTYRCGCGAVIRLTFPGDDKDRDRCPVGSARRRCTEPVMGAMYVCERHAVEITGKVLGNPELLVGHDIQVVGRGTFDRVDHHLGLILQDHAEERAERTRRKQCMSVVYYVQIRPGEVKIGTSINLADRMSSLRAHDVEDLLAAEPGGQELEKMRHHQFNHLRLHCQREDFRQGDDLASHIAMVREHFGPPYELPARLVAETQATTVRSA